MLLKTPIKYNTAEKRQAFARLLTVLLEGTEVFKHGDIEQIPYKPMGRDDFWTLDRNNDWKVRFDDVYTRHVEIFYRYEARSNLTTPKVGVFIETKLMLVMPGLKIVDLNIHK